MLHLTRYTLPMSREPDAARTSAGATTEETAARAYTPGTGAEPAARKHGPAPRRSVPPPTRQRIVILSGLSGAGKTAATKLFEDLGYTCMDNLPGELLPDLAELFSYDRQRFEKVAVVLDVRAGNAPLALAAMRGALEGRGIKPRVIFLEARDDVLIRRFSETRHRHPLAGRRGIAGSIAEERRLLDPVRSEADIIVDTSDLSLRQLKERIFANLEDTPDDQSLVFQLISFGFKYGVPLEADLVFDVRFMENPYYVDTLRHLSGLTPAVRDYVMAQPIAQQFFDFLAKFLELTVPGFKSEGKTRLTVAIGCTGGYHRSIVITEELRQWLEQRGFGTVAVFHRELERE
jgi:RNase adapter protein RapZ